MTLQEAMKQQARPPKYRNNRHKTPEGNWDSDKEERRWAELNLLQRAGEIKLLRRQVRYRLLPSQNGDGRVERPVDYVADFVYYDNKAHKTIVEDVKSPATKTPEYIIKRKLMLYLYGITIKEQEE